jgi:sugar/nucleoside kinase (ribokinase family)
MPDYTYGLTTIGNALVDVLSHVSDDFLKSQEEKHGVKPRTMNLIDEARALELYNDMENSIKQAGGSAANTMAAFASFGGKGAYIGKVSVDTLGQKFAASMQDIGVTYHTTPLIEGPKTGRSMILIEDDGHRTMNTFLGAAVQLGPDDIDEALIAGSLVTYLEGYLFDPAEAKKAFYKAAQIAHEAGRKVSLTLSDPFCVDRHRDDFQDLVENHVDILFANEEEAKSLYKVDTWEEIVKLFAQKCEITCLTRSEKGSVILSGDKIIEIPAEPVAKVVDTTGAGDAYAAGVLYGYAEGMDLAVCGQLGAIAAAEVISHIGPRPQKTLADLIPRKAA